MNENAPDFIEAAGFGFIDSIWSSRRLRKISHDR